MALVQKWKFEPGDRKFVVSSTGASLKHKSVRKTYHKDVNGGMSIRLSLSLKMIYLYSSG